MDGISVQTGAAEVRVGDEQLPMARVGGGVKSGGREQEQVER